MKRISAPPELGKPVATRQNSWVQTDRKSHEEWGRLAMRHPVAAATLHHLAALVGQQNAVVVSQTMLAELVGVTDRSIRNALPLLEAGNWLEIVRIGKGKECAYVLNDRVVWSEERKNLRRSLFSASVLAAEEDQKAIGTENLKRIPRIFRGEQQLPSGDGLSPPSQPYIEGLEPDLPTLAEHDPAWIPGGDWTPNEATIAAMRELKDRGGETLTMEQLRAEIRAAQNAGK